MSLTKICIAGMVAVMLISACNVDQSSKGSYMINYDQALAGTDPAKIPPPVTGSTQEKAAHNKFRNFYKVFSASVIRAEIDSLYAPDAYFRDGFREVHGIDAIKAYFLSSTETFEECIFDIQDAAAHNGNYYFRWIMHLKLKRNPKETLRIVGMSHVRFNAEGLVTFHQDYWDTGIIYEEAPGLGRIITWIRNRI
jgi:hypothetical protein